MSEGHVLIWAGMLLQRIEKLDDEKAASSMSAQTEHMVGMYLQ